MITRSVVLGCIIVGLVACAARIATQRSAPCLDGHWSETRQMTVGEAGLVHVESPQPVKTPRGTVFFGDNALILAISDTGFVRIAGWPRGPGMLAGVVRRNDRFEPVPLPHHMRAFVSVIAAGDRAGTAHVFWGDSEDTTVNQSDRLRGLAYASFDGARWSEPTSVVTDSLMQWHPAYVSFVATGDDIHVMIPAEQNDQHDVIHLTRTSQRTIIVRRHRIPAMYTALAQAGDGALVLAYERGGSKPDRSVIAVVRSADGGATWSPPVDLYRTGSAGAYAVRLISTATGLYALWEGSPPLTPQPDRMAGLSLDMHDSIQVAVSRDDGRTWQRLAGLSTPNGVMGLVVARGADERVHVAYQTGWDDSPPAIVTASLHDDRWTAPTVRGPGPFRPTLTRVGDSLVLTWDDWRTAGPERAPMTQWAVYVCADRTPAR